MTSNPASIDFECAGLLRRALAPNDEASFGFRQVLTAEIGNSYGIPFLL